MAAAPAPAPPGAAAGVPPAGVDVLPTEPAASPALIGALPEPLSPPQAATHNAAKLKSVALIIARPWVARGATFRKTPRRQA
jgi:hypothetical protein